MSKAYSLDRIGAAGYSLPKKNPSIFLADCLVRHVYQLSELREIRHLPSYLSSPWSERKKNGQLLCLIQILLY